MIVMIIISSITNYYSIYYLIYYYSLYRFHYCCFVVNFSPIVYFCNALLHDSSFFKQTNKQYILYK